MVNNKWFWFTAMIILVLGGCRGDADERNALKVAASTTLIGDAAEQVGGDLIDLTVLTPIGADPHTFEPRPQDIVALTDAKVVLINGLGLEEALKPVLESNVQGELIEVSDGIQILEFKDPHANAVEKADEADDEHASGDPHTWMDPNNVMVWVRNIADAFSEADPNNAAIYRKNAEAYIEKLVELDAWICSEVALIPPERRKLVTDHATLGYFAEEYGFEQVGLVVPSFSTNAAPSAQDLAALDDAIRSQHVLAVLVDMTVNPDLAEQVAKDTGIKLIPIYTGSLGEQGSPADSYLNFMRYNVQAIAAGLLHLN